MIATMSESARYRWMVASRILAAAVGGYALTSAATVLVSLLWPMPQAQAVGATTMLSFILYAIIIIWVFAAKNLRRIWATIVTSTVVCSALAWLLLPGAV